MNIYEKLLEVRKAVPYLQKEADGPQFKYVSSSQTLAAVRQAMDEHKLLLIPRVTNNKVTIMDRGEGKPSGVFTELTMEFTWLDAEAEVEAHASLRYMVCPWYGQGYDIAGEKGVGKALTYAEKYFLLKFFNIATDKDDPDSFQQKTPQPPGAGTNMDRGQPSKPEGDKPQIKDPGADLTEAQRKKIWAVANSIYGEETATELKGIVKGRYKKDSHKDLTKKEASDCIELLLKTQESRKQQQGLDYPED